MTTSVMTWLACHAVQGCLAVLAIATPAHAGFLYDFVQDETNVVLATLELNALPAIASHIVGLTFSSEGEALYGFGPKYAGEFDLSNGSVYENAEGVLRHGGGTAITIFRDLNPPLAPGNPADARFEIVVGSRSFPSALITSPPPSRRLQATLTSNASEPVAMYGRGAFGTWRRAVPEATSFALCFAAFACSLATGRLGERATPQ